MPTIILIINDIGDVGGLSHNYRTDIDMTRQSGELAKLLGVARTTKSLSVVTASDYRWDGCGPG
jgi:hypothetical protein